jgi:hypothetical protein
MTDDLERIGRKLAPEMIRDLADLLDLAAGPGTSVATFHHGLGGRVTSMQRTVALPNTSLDARPPKSVESHRAG